jgi:xanthine dehydrogenase molybdopterin-binding subunit B
VRPYIFFQSPNFYGICRNKRKSVVGTHQTQQSHAEVFTQLTVYVDDTLTLISLLQQSAPACERSHSVVLGVDATAGATNYKRLVPLVRLDAMSLTAWAPDNRGCQWASDTCKQ